MTNITNLPGSDRPTENSLYGEWTVQPAPYGRMSLTMFEAVVVDTGFGFETVNWPEALYHGRNGATVKASRGMGGKSILHINAHQPIVATVTRGVITAL